MFTNIKCRDIILSNANENWYILLYDLFSRLWYIATCGPFCKDATQILSIKKKEIHSYNTRSKDFFHVALGTQTFLNISARIWNALIIKIYINVPIFKFKDALKVFLLDNILTITYSK